MTLIRLALVVLHDVHGRVLVQLREPDKPYGGMWGLVGGHIDPGETPEDAARREVREETGFAVGDLTPFGHVIAGGVERFVYHARAGGEVVPGEGVAYEWLSTLDDRPFVPQDAAVLGEFLARRLINATLTEPIPLTASWPGPPGDDDIKPSPKPATTSTEHTSKKVQVPPVYGPGLRLPCRVRPGSVSS